MKKYFQALDVTLKEQFNMSSFMPWDFITNKQDPTEINTSKSIGEIFKMIILGNLSGNQHPLHLMYPMMV